MISERELADHIHSKVDEFREAMNLIDKDSKFWAKLAREENEELLKEIVDLLYVSAGRDLTSMYSGFVEAILESLTGLYPFNTLKEAFDRVHESNMSKLGDDGKPIYNEDGKVMKGPNYKPPYLGDLV